MKADWLALCGDLWGRLRTIADPARLMYFVFVVVGIGGLGVWQSSVALLHANLATYAMGIAAAGAVELVLPESTSRAMKMFAISLGIMAISTSLLYARIGQGQIVWVAPVSAWLLWILSASSNVNIGSQNPVAATGGDTHQVAGDLTGFQT